MRRVTAALLFLFLTVLPLCAVTAGGKVFVLSDPIYGMMDSLFVSCGHALPSSSRPWTASEAASELSKLDGVALDAGQAELRRRIEEMIGEEDREYIAVAAEFSPEMYIHTNTAYATDEMWYYSFNERKPFATLSLKAGLGAFYTYCEMGYGWGRTTNRDEDEAISDLAVENHGAWYGIGAVVPVSDGDLRVVTKSDVYSRTFLFNFPAITQIEIDVPRRTFLTFGWENASLGIYRGRKSWGSSKIGNFIFDGHVSTLNYATLKVFGKKFSFDYTFMLPAQWYSNSQDSEHPAEFRRVFAAHMISVQILDNLKVSASENVMYRFDFPDLDILNPASIYHNNTNFVLLNAIAHVEAEYVPAPGLRLFAQFCLDQATAPTEANDQDGAWGLSGGLSWARVTEKGVFNASAEALYTTPALYRRNYVDFIIWTNNSTNRPYVRYPMFTYMGFRYGGDAVAARADFSYDAFSGIGAHASAQLFVHGDFDMLVSHNSAGDNTGCPDRRLRTPSDPAYAFYIINAGVEYRTTLWKMPVRAFADIAWLSGMRGWHGDAGNALQISLGISVNASSD